ncbi:hypothetical protein HRI97_06260 [Treponema socranskii subsp. buccale]|uniref:hypothetical protein n=1 Tax=Treponema socranskii TaxID=53419 RepID=UPI0020A37EAA|nr:hypothetical protein [Treponema socranskii]UTD02692.1 hypothetical protein HRI97_06260 [Treponema socranskii subsp. buccale]
MITDALKKRITEKQGNTGFIKITDTPVASLSAGQKAALNRTGNTLFNKGDIEQARRIFTTTGYSDGLTRVGDAYAKKNEPIKALKQYVLAHNVKKSEPIYECMARVISAVLEKNA